MMAVRTAAALLLLVGGTASVEAASCAAELGRREAARLAEQCRTVSPATRPPCNPANACALVRDEIRRGCEMLGGDAPDFCGTTDDDDEEE